MILQALPDKIVYAALAQAATTPPFFKSTIFERVCSAAVHATRAKHLIVTNFGISPALRCQIPIAKTSYAFGKPENALAERSSLALVKELIVDCQHFLDVGAHEGIFTFAIADAASRRRTDLHWFEPNGELYDRLCTNLRRNNIRTHGSLAAVSDKLGSTVFFKNLTDDSSGSLADYFTEKHSTTPEIVNTVRLSDYLDKNSIHDAMVKIDVEGAGVEAWSGVAESSNRITYLVMEMLAPEIENRLPYRIITETGMHAYYIRDFDLVASEGHFNYVEPFLNWLFCRLDAESLTARLHGTSFRVVAPD